MITARILWIVAKDHKISSVSFDLALCNLDVLNLICIIPINLGDVGLADRFEEYPKLRELIRLKNQLIDETAHPPMYLKCDLETFDLKSLDQKFDVILIEPPLEEYARSYGVTNVKFWDWDKIMALDIAEVAAQRAFVFLWCGSSDGLDLGRLCLQAWGFRRCEDICWIQTNHKNSGAAKMLEPNAAFQRTKEHCLMGIKGRIINHWYLSIFWDFTIFP